MLTEIKIVKKYELVDAKRLNIFQKSNMVIDNKTKNFLKKYTKQLLTGHGKVPVEYTHGKDHKSPRLYANGVSLQNLPNDIANFISPYYVDLDMVNCAFTILQHLHKKHEISNPNLDYFVEHRNEVLKKIARSKEDMIKIIFYQKIRKDDILPKELTEMHQIIYKDLVPIIKYEYDNLWKSDNQKGNPEGSFLSKVVFTIENAILMTIDKFLQNRNFKPDVLKFDGLLVQKDERLTDELLDELSEYVFEEMKVKIKIAIKPTETTFTEENLIQKEVDLNLDPISPEEEELVKKVGRHIEETQVDQLNIAKLFMIISPFTVLKDIGGQCWSLAQDNFWSFANSKDDGDLHLRIYEDIKTFYVKYSEHLKKLFPETSPFAYFTKAVDKLGTRQWRRAVQADVVGLTQPIDNAVQILMKNAHLVAFSNGVYDLIKGEFRPVNPEDFVLRGTCYPFPTETNPVIRKIIKNFFSSILSSEDMVKFRLDVIASSLYGKHVVEILICLQGFGRNGKGAESKLVHNTFGGYACTLEKQNLMSSSDVADKPNSQMYAVAFKRYISVNEPAVNEKFKADTIKWMTANDPHTVRKPHDCISLTFPIAGNLVISTNHPLKYDRMDKALPPRTKIVEYPYQFVDEPSEKNDKQIDCSLKEKFETTAYRDEFMLMLIEIFRKDFVKDGKVEIKYDYPKEVVTFTLENLVKSLDCKEWFNEKMVATGHHEHLVKRADLWKSFKDYNDIYTLTGTKVKQAEFFRDLGKVFALKKTCNFHYVGLRWKTDVELLDE